MAAAIVAIMCVPVSAAAAEKGEKDKAPANAATINGEGIAYKDFDWEVALYSKRMQAQGKQIPEEFQGQVKKDVLNDMISRELILQESKKKGIKVDPQFVQKEISAIQMRYEDPEQFKKALAEMNMTEDALKKQITQRSAIRDLIDKEVASKITVSDKDTKAFYDENPSLFKRPEEVHAQHILIKSEADAEEKQKKASRQTLVDIKKKIDAGEDFGALAKAHSQCPSAQNNGDLGSFSKGKMVPAFETAAFALKPGQVSDIVETNFGYHLIKVLEHSDPQTLKYEEVQPKINASLRNQKVQTEVQKYVEELRKSAKIEIFVK
ncbi:MAG: hypothetical protein VR64_21830 [Desulfatitalea sp. BRH_c12]|nr:MAG: hypothetical protein VR64_21830 [Desulfatitalea sp. BRH_c12]